MKNITKTKAPLKKGEVVTSRYDNISFIKMGKRYRVAKCFAYPNCGSGWMVEVTYCAPGRMPKNPPILGTVDSAWFIG